MCIEEVCRWVLAPPRCVRGSPMYRIPAGEQAPHFPCSPSSAAPSNSHNVLRCCALTSLNLGYPYPFTKRGIDLVAYLIGLKIFIPGLLFWWVFLRMGICLWGNVLLKPVTWLYFFLSHIYTCLVTQLWVSWEYISASPTEPKMGAGTQCELRFSFSEHRNLYGSFDCILRLLCGLGRCFVLLCTMAYSLGEC